MDKVSRFYLSFLLFIVVLFATRECHTTFADEYIADITCSTAENTDCLYDTDYETGLSLHGGETIQISVNNSENMQGIYIVWDSPVVPWHLKVDNQLIECGQNGFLHEYVSLEGGTSATIVIPDGTHRISQIRVFGEGEIPSDVQLWEPPCEKADILVIPCHADDEILFFGGILPTYAAERDVQVQVIYMTEFWTKQKIREHEKLDGLWVSGIKHYSVNSDFYDVYSDSLKKAESQYDSEQLIEFLVTQIRRFCPQIIVTHDFNGEYGHGYHMLVAKCTDSAVEQAANPNVILDPEITDSCMDHWQVKKLYIHLYPQNTINLDFRVPLVSMGNKTALEIAKEAYQKHVSQHIYNFRVSDEYEYSCSRYGLYYTAVGLDTGMNDLLEHVVPYKDQVTPVTVVSSEEETIGAHQTSITQYADKPSNSENTGLERESITSELDNQELDAFIFAQTRLENSQSENQIEEQGLILICVAVAMISFIFAVLIYIYKVKNPTGKNQVNLFDA